MGSDNKLEQLRLWLLSSEEYWLELEKNGYFTPDASSAWKYYEEFLTSRGYSLIFYKAPEPRHPKVDLSSGLGDPFNPSSTGPFAHHVPENLDTFSTTPIDPWQLDSPRLTLAYDRLGRLVAIKALPASTAQSEVDIFSYLASSPLRASSSNHTLPLLEVLYPDEDWVFIVMPAWRMRVVGFLMWEVDHYFNFMCQSLEGLAFMHENGIAHRDVSPYNILLNQDGTQFYRGLDLLRCISNWDYRLGYIDFGFSSRYDPATDPSTWTDSRSIGNPGYVAPEVFNAQDTKKEYQVLPADIYGLGKVWKGFLQEERDIMRGLRTLPTDRPIPDLYPGELLMLAVPQYEKLIAEMMDIDPSKRPTASEALERFRALREQIPDHIRFVPSDGYDTELISEYISPEMKDTTLGDMLKEEYDKREFGKMPEMVPP